mgnify:CR=1 FL=1
MIPNTDNLYTSCNAIKKNNVDQSINNLNCSPKNTIVESKEQNSTENEHESDSNNMSSHMNKFSLRQDVINKTIFRKIKKFYKKDFKAFFDYTKRRRQSIDEQSNNVF